MYFQNKWLHFEDRLERLEKNLDKHHETVGQIKKAIGHLIQPSSTISAQRIIPSWNPPFNLSPAFEMKYEQECPLQVNYIPRTNIQMLELYKEMKFDNPDGGVWKQGWNINYEVKQWNKHHKLKVFMK